MDWCVESCGGAARGKQGLGERPAACCARTTRDGGALGQGAPTTHLVDDDRVEAGAGVAKDSEAAAGGREDDVAEAKQEELLETHERKGMSSN